MFPLKNNWQLNKFFGFFAKITLILALLVALAIFLPARWGLAQSVPGPDGMPEYRLDFRAGASPPPRIILRGAKNEYLVLPFTVQGGRADNLRVAATGEKGAPGLTCQAYQLRPVPGNLPAGYLVDGLVPLDSGLVMPAQMPLRIAVVLKIPSSHPAGTFSYQLSFRMGSDQHLQPLEVQVWRFTLPDDLPVTILANFRPSREWFARYGVTSPDSFDRAIKAYLRSMREYKINAISGFYPSPVAKFGRGGKLADFPQFTSMLEAVVNDMGYRFFRIPSTIGSKDSGPNPLLLQDHMAHYYPEVLRFLKAKGWERKALVRLWDEPKRQVFPQVAQVYEKFKSAFPQFRTECTGWPPSPELARVIDVWSVNSRIYDPSAIKAARQQGQEIWVYANRLLGTDRLPAHQRLIGWHLYRYDFKGYYLWGMNVWREDPWSTTPDKASNFRRGTFYYPHPQTGMPLPTLRLEALRRGLQDYQYLILLQNAFAQGKINASEFHQIQNKINDMTQDLKNVQPPVNWMKMEELRLSIGESLNKASIGS